jgi:hypothetical protein
MPVPVVLALQAAYSPAATPGAHALPRRPGPAGRGAPVRRRADDRAGRAASPADPGGGRGPDDQKQALRAFEQAHDGAIQRFWKDLRAQLPEAWRLEVRTSGDTGHGPRIMLGARRQDGSLEARAAEGSSDLTPVMTRMGQVDRETLDALITSGIF